MIKLNNIFAGDSDDHKDSDVKINLTRKGALPFFVFATNFVDNRLVYKESLDNLDADVDLYGKDEEGNEIEIKKMCNLVSKVVGNISLYFFDTDKGYLSTVPPTQTIKPDFFRFRSLDSNTHIYPASYDEMNNDSILLSPKNNDIALPKPDDDFGNRLTVKTINIGDIKTPSIMNRFKLDIDNGSLYTENNLLTFLEIDTNTFSDWDPKTLPLFTLYQDSNNVFRVGYTGPQDVDTYYIPLF